MIIWGSRGREIELSSGQFHCPKCDTTRQYKHKRVAKYFTLYFIPLFQTENLGEIVECQFCHQTYKPEVLSYEPPSPADKILLAVRSELETGVPLHMVQQKLIAYGASQETANEIVEIATGGVQVKCSKCGFSYLGTVKLCANCGNRLALSQSMVTSTKRASFMNISEITICPKCKMSVLPKQDGTCPSCQYIIPSP